MARTTLDLDPPILDELKRLQVLEGKPLGRLVSDLLAEALPRHASRGVPELAWSTSPGHLLVDPLDKDALQAVLDGDDLR